MLGWKYNSLVSARACTEKNRVLKKIGFIYFQQPIFNSSGRSQNVWKLVVKGLIHFVLGHINYTHNEEIDQNDDKGDENNGVDHDDDKEETDDITE